jgi:predicted nucleic-acid-binding protein
MVIISATELELTSVVILMDESSIIVDHQPFLAQMIATYYY